MEKKEFFDFNSIDFVVFVVGFFLYAKKNQNLSFTSFEKWECEEVRWGEFVEENKIVLGSTHSCWVGRILIGNSSEISWFYEFFVHETHGSYWKVCSGLSDFMSVVLLYLFRYSLCRSLKLNIKATKPRFRIGET